jgi:hypothetical protein
MSLTHREGQNVVPRCLCGWLVAAIQAVLLPPILGMFFAAPAAAQTTGQPLTETSGGSGLPSPLVLDATRFTTHAPDACHQIFDAITQMMNTTLNGVVDARGFTGPQKCTFNMFPSNATGKLLLGNVVLYATQTQVQPSLFQVEGTGWAIDDNVSNTIIRACTSGDLTNCGGIALGGSPPVLWCWGKSGSCGNGGTGDTAVFGSFTQYALFDCNGLANCVAMQAFDTEEGSGCWHCQFHGWGNSGIGLQICNGTALCQNSSFLDLYATISPLVNTCTTSATPIVVNTGGAGKGGPKFIRQVTVDAGHCTGANPYNAFKLSALKTAVENINLQATTVGLRVAGDNGVNSLTIDGITTGNLVSQAGTQCGTATGTATQSIMLDSANTITNLSLHSIKSGDTGVTVINDCANGRSVTGTGEAGAVGEYLIGPTGGIAFTTSSNLGAFPSGLRQTVNVVAFSNTPTFDLSRGNVQQFACSGGSGTINPSVTNLQPGMEMTFIFVQATSGSVCTVTYPSIMHGAASVSSTLSSVSVQKFIVSNHGTDLYAVAPAQDCNSSCGTP